MTFLCIWAADIGAYTFGKFFGKTPLSDISPKKTVEGAVFGVAASVMVAFAEAIANAAVNFADRLEMTVFYLFPKSAIFEELIQAILVE